MKTANQLTSSAPPSVELAGGRQESPPLAKTCFGIRKKRITRDGVMRPTKLAELILKTKTSYSAEGSRLHVTVIKSDVFFSQFRSRHLCPHRRSPFTTSLRGRETSNSGAPLFALWHLRCHTLDLHCRNGVTLCRPMRRRTRIHPLTQRQCDTSYHGDPNRHTGPRCRPP